jgi:hypothetical protein
MLFAAAVLAEWLLKPEINGAGRFIVCGIMITIGFTVLGAVVNLAANPKMLKYAKKIIRSRNSTKTDQ